MKCILTEIRPTSQYQGKVYAQDAFLDMIEYRQLRVEDAKKLCDDALIGSAVEVQLKLDNIRELETDVEKTHTLVPKDGTPGLEKVRGKIVGVIEETEHKFVLEIDVGAGMVTGHLFKDVASEFSPASGMWIELRRVLGLYLESVKELSNSDH